MDKVRAVTLLELGASWSSVRLWWKINYPLYNDIIMSSMASKITSLTTVHWTVCSGADQRKLQSSASLAFGTGNSLVTGVFTTQMTSNAENVARQIWTRLHYIAYNMHTVRSTLMFKCYPYPTGFLRWYQENLPFLKYQQNNHEEHGQNKSNECTEYSFYSYNGTKHSRSGHNSSLLLWWFRNVNI